MTTFAAVLFDLDGTLLDTLQDLADAANSALKEYGYPAHCIDAYRHFVGEGVLTLFRRALPGDARHPEIIARCAEAFRNAYSRCWHVHTRPYEEIPELLGVISEHGLRLAVLSNKPQEFTSRCVREKLSQFEFEAVMGQRQEVPLKPHPAGASAIAECLAIPPERIAYLGDTGVDMETAVAAGMYPIGALWGFRSREELEAAGAKAVIGRPLELASLLGIGSSLPARLSQDDSRSS
jgi:phosphoglycolate phosphatase